MVRQMSFVMRVSCVPTNSDCVLAFSEDFKRFFDQFGEVEDYVVMRDKFTGRTRYDSAPQARLYPIVSQYFCLRFQWIRLHHLQIYRQCFKGNESAVDVGWSQGS